MLRNFQHPPGSGRLSPDGKIFYVADMIANGVWLIDATRFREIGFIHTGLGAHGLLISRDARYVFMSNRDEGSVSVISTATDTVVHTWRIPGGGSPEARRHPQRTLDGQHRKLRKPSD
jgi:YVTN family beta-propeller protein